MTAVNNSEARVVIVVLCVFIALCLPSSGFAVDSLRKSDINSSNACQDPCSQESYRRLHDFAAENGGVSLTLSVACIFLIVISVCMTQKAPVQDIWCLRFTMFLFWCMTVLVACGNIFAGIEAFRQGGQNCTKDKACGTLAQTDLALVVCSGIYLFAAFVAMMIEKFGRLQRSQYEDIEDTI